MGIKQLRYPLKKLEKSDDYLQIDVIKYIPPGLETQPDSFASNTSDQTYADIGKEGSKVEILLSVILPIPDSVGDTNSAQWEASQLNPLQAQIGSLASTVLKDPKKIASEFVELTGEAGAAFGAGISQAGFQAGLTGLAVRAAGGGGEKYLERGAGISFNQNIELIFQGVNLRGPFDFGFDMVARSEKESAIIKEIIRSFKKYSAVGKGLDRGPAAGIFLRAPQVFRIRYMSGGKPHPFLNKFKICALNNMSVNYAASGTYATYADGTPVHVQLGLSFQELTPIYYEDYLTQDEPEGQPKGSDDGIGVGY